MLLGDLTRYETITDWPFILLGILIMDVLVLFLTKYFPNVFGKSLNEWYEVFGLNAVLADVFIIAIGFAIARYVYAYFVPSEDMATNLGLFLGILLVVQLLHDILFYFAVIKPLAEGHNRMIDIFKQYAKGGAKILAGDAGLMLGSFVFAALLKEAPDHVAVSVGLLTLYTLPYILETTNTFS